MISHMKYKLDMLILNLFYINNVIQYNVLVLAMLIVYIPFISISVVFLYFIKQFNTLYILYHKKVN